MSVNGNFYLGQIVHHRLYGYRGVIIDVDPTFNRSDLWYQQTATSRPDREKPWFKLLIDNTAHESYEAQENLEPDSDLDQINHPDINHYFSRYDGERYFPYIKIN